MHANVSDSNLFLELRHSVTSINLDSELDSNIKPNNFSLSNRSSFDTLTEKSNVNQNSIINTSEQSITPLLSNSNISVVDNNIQLTQTNFHNNDFDGDGLISSNAYSSKNGYGLANAAAAVAEVVGEDTFDDVADTGGENWGVDAVNAPEAWEQGYTGEGVVVAVLDTGVAYNHNDLKDNIWTNSDEIANNGTDDDGNGYVDDFYGWNFDGNNNNTIDKDGHGTHVSGTIAGMNNDFGVTGVAYDAQIMPVKVLDDFGSGSNSSVADGIYYAVDNGADVINLSLGSSFPSFGIQAALDYASSEGVLVVMAAGNSGGDAPLYPARYADQYGVAVGAVNEDKELANFSNRAGSDTLTYVTAPGVDIYSTLPDNQYDSYSGTSMATPHIAGVAALMLSANPDLDNNRIRQILRETSSGGTENGTETPETPSFGDYLDDFFPSQNLAFNSDGKYMMRSNTSVDFNNTTTVNASSNINNFATAYPESQVVDYQQYRENQSKQIFSRNIDMLEEDDILI